MSFVNASKKKDSVSFVIAKGLYAQHTLKFVRTSFTSPLSRTSVRFIEAACAVMYRIMHSLNRYIRACDLGIKPAHHLRHLGLTAINMNHTLTRLVIREVSRSQDSQGYKTLIDLLINQDLYLQQIECLTADL